MTLVFSFGSAEKGQLGNGTTGERITTGNKTAFDIEYQPSQHSSIFLKSPILITSFQVYVKEMSGKKIVKIASGQQHSLALDETGFVVPPSHHNF